MRLRRLRFEYRSRSLELRESTRRTCARAEERASRLVRRTGHCPPIESGKEIYRYAESQSKPPRNVARSGAARKSCGPLLAASARRSAATRAELVRKIQRHDF